jgi:hypothetical protein
MSRETELLRWDVNMEQSRANWNPGDSVVYVAQKRPKLDLATAVDYGKMVTVFREFDQFMDPSSSTTNMLRNMGNFRDHDYIINVGHPIGVGLLAAAALRQNGGRAKMLVWSPKLRRYYSVQLDISSVPQRGVQV